MPSTRDFSPKRLFTPFKITAALSSSSRVSRYSAEVPSIKSAGSHVCPLLGCLEHRAAAGGTDHRAWVRRKRSVTPPGHAGVFCGEDQHGNLNRAAVAPCRFRSIATPPSDGVAGENEVEKELSYYDLRANLCPVFFGGDLLATFGEEQHCVVIRPPMLEWK